MGFYAKCVRKPPDINRKHIYIYIFIKRDKSMENTLSIHVFMSQVHIYIYIRRSLYDTHMHICESMAICWELHGELVGNL